MSEITDESLNAMDNYGGPSGSKSEARLLIDNLRAARRELRRLQKIVAHPEVAECIKYIELRDLLERQAKELAAMEMNRRG